METSLIYHMEPELKKNKGKEIKTENQIRSEKMVNGQESMESVLREEESLWWEEFMKRQVLSQEWKWESIDDESGEMTEEDEVMGIGRSDSEVQNLEIAIRLLERNGVNSRHTFSAITSQLRAHKFYSSANQSTIQPKSAMWSQLLCFFMYTNHYHINSPKLVITN